MTVVPPNSLPPNFSAEILDAERLAVFETLGAAVGTDVLSELVSAFLDSLPTRLTEINAAVAASEMWQVEFLAHRLKGSASNLGAAVLLRAASLLEQAAILKNPARCSELLAEVSRAAAATDQELSRLLEVRRAKAVGSS